MKLIILYRPNSEHETEVEAYVRDFQRQHDAGKAVELVSLNTREGASKAAIYGIVAYPAIIALSDDGAALNIWQGRPLPLMSEVAGYAYSG